MKKSTTVMWHLLMEKYFAFLCVNFTSRNGMRLKKVDAAVSYLRILLKFNKNIHPIFRDKDCQASPIRQ